MGELQTLATIALFGGFGGFAQSLQSTHFLKRTSASGHWIQIFIGVLAAMAVSGFLLYAGVLDVSGFFVSGKVNISIPDGIPAEISALVIVENERRTGSPTDWISTFLALGFVSVGAGFAGIAILSRAAWEVEKRLGDQEQRVEQAEGDIQELVREARIQRGMREVNHKKYTEALDHFSEVYNDAQATEAQRKLCVGQAGRCHRWLGDLEKAVECLREMVEIDPTDHIARYNYACYLWLRGDDVAHSVVLEHLDAAENYAPGFVVGYACNDVDFAEFVELDLYKEWAAVKVQQIENPVS